MLALVDNVVTQVTPVLDLPASDFRVGSSSREGMGRVTVSYGGKLIESGVVFYKMRGEFLLNHRTGEFQLARRTFATIRAVFAGQHEDVEVQRK